MIETEQTVVIDAAIGRVWDYAHDIEKWAGLMPGLQSCTIVDADTSRWTLKVGAGGLVRTANVLVHVDQWDGPERVIFTYELEGDPVKGGGSYTASPKTAHQTEVILHVRVEGSGALAPMWEAMGRPLLPKLAKSFAEQLKIEIEKVSGTPMPQEMAASGTSSAFAGIGRWLRNVWRAVLVSGAR